MARAAAPGVTSITSAISVALTLLVQRVTRNRCSNGRDGLLRGLDYVPQAPVRKVGIVMPLQAMGIEEDSRFRPAQETRKPGCLTSPT